MMLLNSLPKCVTNVCRDKYMSQARTRYTRAVATHSNFGNEVGLATLEVILDCN